MPCEDVGYGFKENNNWLASRWVNSTNWLAFSYLGFGLVDNAKTYYIVKPRQINSMW